MNSRTLKKNLGKGFDVKGRREDVRVTTQESGREVTFDFARNSGWSEQDAAAYVKSKLPAQTIVPNL